MLIQQGIDNRPSLVPVDTLVYLGAGSGEQLNAYLAYDVQRALLVEADPQQIETLKARSTQLPRARVICAAVAGAARSAVLYRYNLPGAASLHEASGLRQLFPGLREVDRQSVDAVTPAELLLPLQLASGQNNMLVIDLPGEDLAVLDTLRRSGHLHCFSQLRLHCGRQPLYEGSEPAARILVWLREEGFDVLDEDDSQNPDCPCWTLQRNALQIQHRELLQQLEQLKADLVAKEGETADTRDQFVEQQRQTAYWQQESAKLSAERDELARQRNEQTRRANHLDQERESLEGMASELCSQLAEQQQQTGHWTLKSESLTAALETQQIHWRQEVEQLEQERKAQTRLLEEQHLRLEEMAQTLNKSASRAYEQQQEIARLVAERDQQTQRADQLAHEGQAQETATTELHEQLAEQRRQTMHWRQQVEQLVQTRDAQTQLAEELQLRLDELAQTLDKATLVAAEQQQEIAQLHAERDQQAQRADQLVQDCQTQDIATIALRAELAEQQRQTEYWLQEVRTLKDAAGERQTQIDQMIHAKDALAQLIAEREESARQANQVQEASCNIQAELVEQRRQTEYWLLETDKLKHTLAEEQKRGDELERQFKEKQHRQTLLDEELLKAEAQIHLISDILIREKSF